MKGARLEEAMKNRLQEAASGKVLFNEPLFRHTSMGVGGKAEAMIFPGTVEDLGKTVHFLKETGLAFMAMGNGTNLIVRDGGYRGVVVSLRKLQGMDMEDAGGRISLHAGAGVSLAEVINLSLSEGLTGMEFCAGIPGSVGGAVRMNAGAYGRTVADVLISVTVMTDDGDIKEREKETLDFGYRKLALPPGCFILSARFSLERGERRKVGETVEKILALRREKHPLEYRSAGSIFKNPKGIPAGRIIDELGLKGLAVGGAKISEMHGNFIVNTGGAKAADIIALIDRVKKKVWEERGIALEAEVHIIGDDE